MLGASTYKVKQKGSSKGCTAGTQKTRKLCILERTPRQYEKRSADYWDNQIKEKRKITLPTTRSAEPEASENECVDIENMSPVDIRNQLKGLGIATRVRNVKKLQKMYNDAILANARN